MSDDNRPDPHERIDRLEAVIAKQNETIRKLLPDRRDVLKAGGGAAVGGLAAFGLSGGASGQDGAAGSQGTEDEPNDVWAWNLDVANELVDASGETHGGEIADTDDITITDGDDTERQIWVIANGASDPSGADDADLIFEEES